VDRRESFFKLVVCRRRRLSSSVVCRRRRRRRRRLAFFVIISENAEENYSKLLEKARLPVTGEEESAFYLELDFFLNENVGEFESDIFAGELFINGGVSADFVFHLRLLRLV
jgi:hypothetical protein